MIENDMSVIIDYESDEYKRGFRDSCSETILLLKSQPNLSSQRYIKTLEYVISMIDGEIL